MCVTYEPSSLFFHRLKEVEHWSATSIRWDRRRVFSSNVATVPTATSLSSPLFLRLTSLLPFRRPVWPLHPHLLKVSESSSSKSERSLHISITSQATSSIGIRWIEKGFDKSFRGSSTYCEVWMSWGAMHSLV